MLARKPEDINLRVAYEAFTPEPQFLARHRVSCQEAVPFVVGNFVNEICADAEQTLLARLEAMTIRMMDETVRARLSQTLRASREAQATGVTQ